MGRKPIFANFQYLTMILIMSQLEKLRTSMGLGMAQLRMSMGLVYCLEHMHKLNPPVVPRNFSLATVTDDYAAKVSDLYFWNDTKGSDCLTNECTMLALSDSIKKRGCRCDTTGSELVEV